VAAILLGFTNMATRDVIAQQLELENTEARKSALPIAEEFEEVKGKELENALLTDFSSIDEVYQGKKDGEIIGYTFKITSGGYGGEMVINVGISVEGKVTGIKIVSHSETPGLGAKAAEEDFQNQYIDKSADSPLSVIKGNASGNSEIEAIAGATVTSNAVTDSVNLAIELYHQLFK
jgi:electron transport complex protein RnfG